MEDQRYHYRLTPTGKSSNELGPCEVCMKHCSETFVQSETRQYHNPETGTKDMTTYGCQRTAFGHEDCLITLRKSA